MIVDIDGVKWTKDAVQQITFEQMKWLLAFIEDERLFLLIAKWHSEEAEEYALSVLDNL